MTMPYGKVEESYWDAARFLSRGARELMTYLLTCRHKTRLGMFILDPMYAAADLRCSDYSPTAEDIESAIHELETADPEAPLVLYDRTTRVIWVRSFLRFNVIANQRVVTGALSQLAGIPDTALFPHLKGALERWKRPHYAPLIEAVERRIEEGAASRSGNGIAYRIGNRIGNRMPYRCPANGIPRQSDTPPDPDPPFFEEPESVASK